MNIIKKPNIGLASTLFCILLSSCGPSPEELVVTYSAETAAAASPTPLPTYTPRPTFTPTPTPTPTPIPSPDAKAMINWEELNLPSGYRSLYPLEIGYGEGDWIMGVQKEDGTQIDYYIENSFIFAEQWPEAVYGWTVIYPTEFDKKLLDAYIDMFPDQLAGIVNGFGATLISLFEQTEYSDIGDKSAEAWAVYVLDGNWWSFWGASFRIDDIGGFVFLRHSFGDEPFIEIGDLAQIYAQNIENPTYSCNFSTISPYSDYDVPAFEYKIEGFYPVEPIMISISGDVRVDGEPQRITVIDEDPFLTDENGMYHGIMRFGDEVLELASSEFELIIISYASKCTIRQIVTWPGELSLATTPEPTTSQSVIQDVEIISDFSISGASGSFVASGIAVDAGTICALGDVYDIDYQDISPSSEELTALLVNKQFVCDDASGSFEMELDVLISESGTTGTWRIVDGLGRYDMLSGIGTFTGRYLNDDNMIDTIIGTVNP